MRLLVAAAAVVGAALLLKVLPAYLVLALFVGGVAAFARSLKRRSKRDAAEGRAATLGLRREEHDPIGVRAMPLSLFERAPEGAIEGLLTGTRRGVQVHVFDYAFRIGLTEGSAVHRRFACALGQVGGSVPATVVEPRSFLTLFPEPPELDPSEISTGRFADLFDVRGTDPSFARSIVDERVRGWLLELDEGWGFEIRDQALLVYGPRPDRGEISAAVDVLADLLDRLPETVRSAPRIPPGPADARPPGDEGRFEPGGPPS